MEQKAKLKAAETAMRFVKIGEGFFESLMSVDFNNRNEEGKYK